MRGAKARVGDVVQLALPDGTFAYGRVLHEGVAFYRHRSSEPGRPPIGSRDYEFVVGVHDAAVAQWPVVGTDPGANPDDDWGPRMSVRDPITGRVQIYQRGHLRPATEVEVVGLEPVASWDTHHIIDRLTGKKNWLPGR